MILMALDTPTGKELFVGLTVDAVKDLIGGKMVMQATMEHHKESLKPLGLSKVVITSCTTEQDLIAIVNSLFPNSPSKIHPDLYS